MWWGCTKCTDSMGDAHWLDVTYDLAAVDRTAIARFGRVWDYAGLLPVAPSVPPSLGEGGTPLLRLGRLNTEVGLPNLHLKLETVNPTSSFKDRFQTVAMAAAVDLDYRRAVIVTTGNAGVACSAMAAAAGIELIVIASPGAPVENVRQMRLFGAHVVIPSADRPVIEQAREIVTSLVQDFGVYPASVGGTHSGASNPYGVEGYKTIAFEVAAQMGRTPDRFCAPVSGGDALYGPFRGFTQLAELGLADGVPAMTSCQAAGASFVAPSLAAGLDHMVRVEPDTVALSIGDPTGSASTLTAIRATGGDAWTVDDDAIVAAVGLLGRHGVCAEAAAATPIAALQRAAGEGLIDPDEHVVALVTGSGLRWPAQVDAAVGADVELLPPDPVRIIEHLERNP